MRWIPQGPKYLAIVHFGLPYYESYLWFWVDTLQLGSWTLIRGEVPGGNLHYQAAEALRRGRCAAGGKRRTLHIQERELLPQFEA